jgi:hypothetical protein
MIREWLGSCADNRDDTDRLLAMPWYSEKSHYARVMFSVIDDNWPACHQRLPTHTLLAGKHNLTNLLWSCS